MNLPISSWDIVDTKSANVKKIRVIVIGIIRLNHVVKMLILLVFRMIGEINYWTWIKHIVIIWIFRSRHSHRSTGGRYQKHSSRVSLVPDQVRFGSFLYFCILPDHFSGSVFFIIRNWTYLNSRFKEYLGFSFSK
jgi:hypothetical protein